jgi:hypothetical protein
MTAAVARRETAVRCPECHRQASRTAGTPLHHFKLPLWVFGYLLSEAMTTFPQMISAAQIRRRLGVSKSTSLLLKRRLQLFLTDFIPLIKDRMASELQQELSGLVLPAKGDVSKHVANKPVVHMDTLAMFSATQRANGGRSRHRHSGQTSSIYLTEKVAEERGKFQIGTLVHTIAIKQGPVILDSVPGLTQKEIQPLFDFIPKHTPTFTDDGYPWLSRYNKNHRAVNHSARAKDKKRNVWARNRWSRGGVHNQVAEGTQRIVKASFLAAYGYFNPKFSQLYLNEYSALKALRVYGLESLLQKPIVWNVAPRYSGSSSGTRKTTAPDFLRRKIAENQYIPPAIGERGFYDNQNSRRQIRGKLRDLFNDNEFFAAKQAHIDYLNFWQDAPRWKRQHERQYGATARKLWHALSRRESTLLSNIARKHELSHPLLVRIAREWARLDLAEVEELKRTSTSTNQLHVWVRRRIDILPDLLYSWDRERYCDSEKKATANVAEIEKPEHVTKGGISTAKRNQYIKEMMR